MSSLTVALQDAAEYFQPRLDITFGMLTQAAGRADNCEPALAAALAEILRVACGFIADDEEYADVARGALARNAALLDRAAAGEDVAAQRSLIAVMDDDDRYRTQTGLWPVWGAIRAAHLGRLDEAMRQSARLVDHAAAWPAYYAALDVLAKRVAVVLTREIGAAS